MATIRTAIQITDGLSPAVRAMNRSLGIVINTFETLQGELSQPVDIASLHAARAELNQAGAAFSRFESDIREADKKQEKFNRTLHSGNQAARGIGDSLRNLAFAAGGMYGTKKLVEQIDSYANIQARLKMINDGQQTVDQLNKKIFDSAYRARSEYNLTAETVAKLGATASHSFSGNDEMIKFSELMTKSFKISGASAQEQTSAVYQLTQAMAAGKLQGDEFRSILENAPLLAQAIAKQMDLPIGKLKDMSSDGKITANIIKSALFNSASEIEARFSQMPYTFSDIANRIKTTLTKDMQPTFEKISQWLNSSQGVESVINLTNGFVYLANTLGTALMIGLSLYNLIANNWPVLAPFVWGLVVPIIAFNAALLIGNVLLAANAGISTIAHAASLMRAKATLAETVAQYGLNAALLACPVTWIILAVIAVVAALAAWVHHNGGVEISLKKLWNVAALVWDGIKIGSVSAVFGALNAWDQFQLGLKAVVFGIQIMFGNMKVTVLMIIQDMVNGALDLINGMIETVNKIPGVAINPIEKAQFGSEAAIKNQADTKAKVIEFQQQLNVAAAKKAERAHTVKAMSSVASTDAMRRNAELRVMVAQKQGKEQKALSFDDLLPPLTATAANTTAIRDSVSISEEELKYLRDIAEQEVVNRFTTAKISVQQHNTFGDIRETADLDGVITHLEEKVRESIATTAEGVREDL